MIFFKLKSFLPKFIRARGGLFVICSKSGGVVLERFEAQLAKRIDICRCRVANDDLISQLGCNGLVLPAGKSCQRFFKEWSGGRGLRSIDFPGEDAIAASPCASAPEGDFAYRGCDGSVDNIHVTDQFHIQSSSLCIRLVIHYCVEQKLGV